MQFLIKHWIHSNPHLNPYPILKDLFPKKLTYDQMPCLQIKENIQKKRRKHYICIIIYSFQSSNWKMELFNFNLSQQQT